MALQWVENMASGPRMIGGKLLQRGEGTFIEAGPLVAGEWPAPERYAHEVASGRGLTLSQEQSASFLRPGLCGAFGPFSAGFFPGGGSNLTLVNQVPALDVFNGLRLMLKNSGTSPATLTSARVGSPAVSGDPGGALSMSLMKWAGADSVALTPVGGSETNPTSITLHVSDNLVISPANPALPMSHVRSDWAGLAAAMQIGAGDGAAWNAATGLTWLSGFASPAGSVADIALTAGQIVVPAAVLYSYARRTRTVAAVGGSTLRGQGTEGNAMGFIYRGCAAASSSACLFSPLILSRSAAKFDDALVQADAALNALAPEHLAVQAGSGNESVLDFAAFERFKAGTARLLDRADRVRTKLHLVTLQPGNLPPTAELLRRAQNAWMLSLAPYVPVIDIATPLESPTNQAQLRPEYNSGDDIHTNAAGAVVVAPRVAQSLIRAS